MILSVLSKVNLFMILFTFFVTHFMANALNSFCTFSLCFFSLSLDMSKQRKKNHLFLIFITIPRTHHTKIIYKRENPLGNKSVAKIMVN